MEEQLYSVIDYRYRNMLSTFYYKLQFTGLRGTVRQTNCFTDFEMCSGVKVMGDWRKRGLVGPAPVTTS